MAKYDYEWKEPHEKKLMKVLQYFLSLHEADEVFDALYRTDIDEEGIENLLGTYKLYEEEF